MSISPQLSVFSLLLLFAVAAVAEEPLRPQASAPPQFRWDMSDTALALINHDRVVWRWNYAAKLAKPYFHPVSLTDGTVLTAPSPPDHPWHRALWFSWKMLNGVNYWEEDPQTGRSEGLTEMLGANVSSDANGSATIEMKLSYHPHDAPSVLTEQRMINVEAPDRLGVYRINWTGVFTAGRKDLLLEGGTAGGGYAGLSVRISQSSRDWILIDSEGRRDVPTDGQPGGEAGLAANTHRQRARWMDFTLVDVATGRPCGIAILDHPSNPRHPSRWHNVMAARVPFGYFSPAMLWSDPYQLPTGHQFTLRYRLIVHPDRTDRDAIEREWQAFARQ